MPLLVVLALVGAISSTPRADSSCNGNTHEIEVCVSERLTRHEANLAVYVSAARDRIRRAVAEAPVGASTIQNAPKEFDAAEIAWSKYRDAECDAVYDYWSQGTIRGLKSLNCRIILTQRHAHTIWSEWLRYEDDTPPILPEPPPATYP
jgi:uncharacterized protein YecT (DUF1311 family)